MQAPATVKPAFKLYCKPCYPNAAGWDVRLVRTRTLATWCLQLSHSRLIRPLMRLLCMQDPDGENEEGLADRPGSPAGSAISAAYAAGDQRQQASQEQVGTA